MERRNDIVSVSFSVETFIPVAARSDIHLPRSTNAISLVPPPLDGLVIVGKSPRTIAYFTYFAPKVGNYRMAPVDQFGNATQTWDHLQNVNLQIAKLAPTLLRLNSDEVYHFGSVPEGSDKPSEKSLVRAIGGEFAVGDFTHADGSRYVMLVNKDLQRSIPCAPQFRVSPKRAELFSPYSGSLTAFEGEQIWLAPGAGALLKLTF